jgi:RimJ/RimL family protein N-acetyltransferase
VRNEVLTDRLLLREWIDEDIDTLSRIFASEEVWRYPLGRGLTIEEIVSVIEPDNAASRRVAEKLGMRLDLATVHPALRVPLLIYRIFPPPRANS